LQGPDRQENLRRAIACYDSALRVRTESDYPLDWSMTQANLGMVLEELAELTGDATLGRDAIACYEAARRGYTRCGYPEEANAMREYAAEAQGNFSP